MNRSKRVIHCVAERWSGTNIGLTDQFYGLHLLDAKNHSVSLLHPFQRWKHDNSLPRIFDL